MTENQNQNPDDNPDLDDSEMVHQSTEQPRSLLFRTTRWIQGHLLLVLAVGVAAVIVVPGLLSRPIPRWVRVVGLSGSISLVVLGRPVANRVRAMLWNPSFVYLVATGDEKGDDAGICKVPAQRFREWTLEEDELDWIHPRLAFCERFDVENKVVVGTWLGSLSGRQLMTARDELRKVRGQLESDAQRGFVLDNQSWMIVRRAAQNAVRHIRDTFERGALPDEGREIDDAVDEALEDFGLERPLSGSSDESPTADVPGDDVDLLDGAGETGADAEAQPEVPATDD